MRRDAAELLSSPDSSEHECGGEVKDGTVDMETLCHLGCAQQTAGTERVCGRCQCAHCDPQRHPHTKSEGSGCCRGLAAHFSEGYGTEEVLTETESGQAAPQGESDADADIEDTDNRLREAESLQRISSKRRRRQRITKQDTTESEDDGGRSHRVHRWSLRLSPHRTHNRTIEEVERESVSQVRPLVLCRGSSGMTVCTPSKPEQVRGSALRPPGPLSWPLALSLLLLLPLSVLLILALLPLVRT
ncbi:uncharacterized protein [Lepisosteus oculatus]|uniref:uncharacterized protein isoform X2 n=1 Tax=Lepisosteus oculatus TaxID=7918 RepID=UPI0037139CD0